MLFGYADDRRLSFGFGRLCARLRTDGWPPKWPIKKNWAKINTKISVKSRHTVSRGVDWCRGGSRANLCGVALMICMCERTKNQHSKNIFFTNNQTADRDTQRSNEKCSKKKIIIVDSEKMTNDRIGRWIKRPKGGRSAGKKLLYIYYVCPIYDSIFPI